MPPSTTRRASATKLSKTQLSLIQEFGLRLRAARKAQNKDIEEVAARARLSAATVFKAEKGDPGIALGNYLLILSALEMGGDIAKLAVQYQTSEPEEGRRKKLPKVKKQPKVKIAASKPEPRTKVAGPDKVQRRWTARYEGARRKRAATTG